jgi:hypothetical protein
VRPPACMVLAETNVYPHTAAIMSIFAKPSRLDTLDEILARYAVVTTDLAQVRAELAALRQEWDSTLRMLRKERSRIEAAEHRFDRKQAEDEPKENRPSKGRTPPDPDRPITPWERKLSQMNEG